MRDSQSAGSAIAEARTSTNATEAGSFDHFDVLGDEEVPQAPSQEQPRPWYRRPGPLIGLGVVVVLILLLLTPLAIRALRGGRTQYQTATVTRGTITLSVGASGNVAAPIYDLAFAHQGTIASIDVSVGQQVNAGATLATLTYTVGSTTQTETLIAPHSGTVAAVNGVVDGSPTSQTFIEIDDLTATYLTLNVNESDIASVAVGQTVQFTVSAYPNLNPIVGVVSNISPSGQSSSNVVTFPVIATINTNTEQGAHLFPGMSVNATIINTQRANALVIPASAVSYAHSQASSGVVSSTDVTNALNQARQMANNIKKAGGVPASDNPTANYVLELTGTSKLSGGTGKHLTVVPVVLGLTDGTNYEVLSGLSQGDSIVIS
ncbi:MAG TPA: HlyD family efflux transporter periplasmic adaptor subunit [Ktedonobacterales bacterium]|nr:HlyD family efflux transporter periplasmic adaptor subunit [Ktedonobacterales bacterium]